ncbi:MAG: hypothetical protein E7592_04930 [Ruminococcaceae bacterium]|nr:hypothetical protein [Oscillospiraceae bacterium]
MKKVFSLPPYSHPFSKTLYMNELDLYRHFQKICKFIFKFDVVSKYPEYFSESFEQFKTMYLCLRNKDGFDKLFHKIFSDRLDINIKDFITEIVIAYTITSKNNNVEITYEPDYQINGANRPPDLRIHFESYTFYIQIKRMSKSYSYQDNLKKFGDSDTMVIFDDIQQIVGALDKAARFTPKNANDIFLIIQLIPPEIPSSNIEISEVLYGREVACIDLKTGEFFLKRQKVNGENYKLNGGFFYSESGKRVDAYIKATEANGLFFPYDYEMFINHTKAFDKKLIYNILDICAEYNATTYFDNNAEAL